MEDMLIRTREHIRKELEQMPGWEQRGNKLVKAFRCRDFMDLMSLLYELAPVFGKLNHHPDMHVAYDTVLFELTTHDAEGKVTDKDIQPPRQLKPLFVIGMGGIAKDRNMRNMEVYEA